MARKKTLPHRRARKKIRIRPAGALESTQAAVAEPVGEAPPRRTPPAPSGPKGPAVVIDFRDIELYVRRELVRIAIVAAVVFGFILVAGSLTH